MTRTLAIAATLTAIVALSFATTAEAGGCHRKRRIHHNHHHHARVIVTPPVYVQPAPQWHWYFGMNATLTNIGGYRGLRITYVVPGGPAHLAGLEPGDVIFGSNGLGFQTAWTTHQAITILRQSVQHGIGGAASSYGMAQLTVRDLRTGGLVAVMTQPHHNNGGIASLALR